MGTAAPYVLKQSTDPIMAAEWIDHEMPRFSPAADDLNANGRYLALTVCSECHGSDLRGSPGDGTPPLAVVAAYSLDNFRNLMRTGQTIGDRQLGMMSDVAVGRFADFTDQEIDSLHAYLQTLATTTVEL